MKYRMSSVVLRGLTVLILAAVSVEGVAVRAHAQGGKKGSIKVGKVTEPSGPRGSGGGSLAEGIGILSKVVDPTRYVLGPGDRLIVSLWGEYSSLEHVTVSADGKVSLDTIGELKLVGLTLEQARALLKTAVVKYYRNVDSGISLSGLRSFKVWVLGAVSAPGSFSATLDTRASEMIGQAGGVLPGGSRRSIQVKRDGKVRAMADLNAFLRRGDDTADPFLQDGDMIFVPPLTGSLIRIFDLAAPMAAGGEKEAKGNVATSSAAPIEFELAENQKLSDLVFELGGLNPNWDPDSAYVVRNHPGKEGGVTKIKVELEQLLIYHNTAKDVMLQNGDQVFFGAQLRSPFLNGKGELIGIEKPYDRQQAR